MAPTLQERESGCSCMGWCDKAQLSAFFSGLSGPSPINSSNSSPWHRYVRHVYNTERLELPLDLTTFGFFTMPSMQPRLSSRWSSHAQLFPPFVFDTSCRPPPSTGAHPSAERTSWCGVSACRAYSSVPMPGLRLNLSKLAPWPWNWQPALRHQHGLYAVEHKVFYVRGSTGAAAATTVGQDGTRNTRWKTKFEFSRPGRISLYRSAGDHAPIPVRNHSFVEVFRTRRSHSFFRHSTATGKGAPPRLSTLLLTPHEGVNWGCWFSPLLPPWHRGSGIFVNVGRTLVVSGRRHAKALFKLPSPSSTSTTPRSSPPARALASTHSTAASGAPTPTRQFRGAAIPERDDSLWAIEARARGFDSVQILRGADGLPELLVSSAPCLSQERPIGTCPPLPLWTGDNASRECVCSESSHVLNCGG
jgi:hypothetical protein